jgi:aldehyde:ferredoxin oxidoreductase
VYILVQNGVAELRDASTVWGKSTIETREVLKQELGNTVAVVACGPAGENLVSYATLLADNDASGSSGFGAVMGSKKLKAIAVRGNGKLTASDPDKLEELVRYVQKLSNKYIPSNITSGFAELKAASGQFDSIPKDIAELHFEVLPGQRVKRDLCFGCIGNGQRIIVESRDGKTRGKSYCASALFYINRAVRYHGELNEVPFYAARLCDAYGIDSLSIMTMIMWLSRCGHAGILNDENTGIPLSKLGSWEYIETLVRKISLREGFGDTLAQGIEKAAGIVGSGADKLITDYKSKAGHHLTFCPRMFPAHGLLYAMEPRQPIHQLHEMATTLFAWLSWASSAAGAYLSSDVFRRIAKQFWGSELAADFSTYEGKALAAIKIQNRAYAKESLILCDFAWPIMHTFSNDHVGDPTLESRILSAVTGVDIDESGLDKIGEKIFNLQRAILAREGHHGRNDDKIPEAFFTMPIRGDEVNPDCKAPGKNGEIISRKGAVVDRSHFEKMKEEYYGLRGWDVATGFQTAVKLKELGLNEVAHNLVRAGLAV